MTGKQRENSVIILRKCENCAFWDPNKKTTTRGLCRLNPPTVLADMEIPAGFDVLEMLWPDTAKNDWCGKFEAKSG